MSNTNTPKRKNTEFNPQNNNDYYTDSNDENDLNN